MPLYVGFCPQAQEVGHFPSTVLVPVQYCIIHTAVSIRNLNRITHDTVEL
jgi:hypothetical protein